MKIDFLNNRQLTWASVAVAGVSTGLSLYKGLKAASEDKKAAAEGAALRRPFYSIPTEDIQNRNIAEQEATGGLTAAEKLYAGEQRERAFGSSAEALKEAGGGPNEFAGLNKIFDDSLKSQSALDSQAHKSNIEFFTKANSELAAQKGIQFGINELQPYESKLKEIQDRRIAAKTNENNAINEGIGGLTAGATGVSSYLRTNPGTPTGQPATSNPYNRTFGLENTGSGGVVSPAASWSVLNPDAASGVTASAPLPESSDLLSEFTF